MIRTNIVPVFVFATIFFASFAQGENAALFMNGLGLAVVLSGTMGAMFLSYSAKSIWIACRVSLNAYWTKLPSADEVIETLMQLLIKSRTQGILALEDSEKKITIGYLKRTLSLLVDNYKVEEIRDILHTEMY